MSQKPEGFNSLNEVAEAIHNYQPHRKRTDTDGLAKNVRLGADGKYHWHRDPRFHTATREFQKRHERQVAHASWSCPFCWFGAGFRRSAWRGAHDFLNLCPHSEHVRVDDAAHMVAGDRTTCLPMP
jgi:non-heme chloroperoxidase